MGRSGTVTCPGRFALALGAVGVAHQDGHLHDIGLLQERRVHSRPGLEQHAGVPGGAGAQLLWHQRQACNVKARGSLSTCEARGSQINSANPNTAWLGLTQGAFSTPWLFTACRVLPPHSGLAHYPLARGGSNTGSREERNPARPCFPGCLAPRPPRAEAAVPRMCPAPHPRGSASTVPRGFTAGRALISKPQPMSWAQDMPPSVQKIHAPETRCRGAPGKARCVASGSCQRRGLGGAGRATRPLSPCWVLGLSQGTMARLVQGRRAGSGPSHLPLVIIGLETWGCIRGTDPGGGLWRAWDRGYNCL